VSKPAEAATALARPRRPRSRRRLGGLGHGASVSLPSPGRASFNLDAVKKQIEEMIKAHSGQ
jgi:hypothetical protein